MSTPEATRPAWVAALSQAHAALASPSATSRATYLLRHGSMRVGLYAPAERDDQTPHDQDEIYIVLSGEGEFVKGEVSCKIAAGDVLFVEAGAAHRFERFSEDFQTWVVFWGPRGGETVPAEGRSEGREDVSGKSGLSGVTAEESREGFVGCGLP